jgi:hypothetical protein
MDMARSFVTVETAGKCQEDLSRPAHGNGAGAKVQVKNMTDAKAREIA